MMSSGAVTAAGRARDEAASRRGMLRADEDETAVAELRGVLERRLLGSSAVRAPELGRYALGERLGAGAGGTVYRGHDPTLDRPIAIKLVRTDAQRQSGGDSRLLREARALASLTHPNVVAIHDVGTYDGDTPGVFIVMEHVDGTDLAAWLRERPRSWREIVDVFLLAGAGLAAAHEQGFVHRDFKPSNVLIGTRGEVKVADFGLARRDDAPRDDAPGPGSSGAGDRTWNTIALGTPPYMAPEQHRGAPADARADQYGFCAALLEALAGTPIFTGSTMDELLAAKMRLQLSATPSGVPRGIRRALVRGLSPQPETRHASMTVLLRALRRARWTRTVVPWLAAGLGALCIATAAWAFHRAHACDDDGAMLREWHARRTAVEARMSSSGVAFAPASTAMLLRTLDERHEQWSSASRSSCVATRLEDAWPAEHAEATQRCLARERLRIRTLVDALLEGESGAPLVAAAPVAALSLPDPASCLEPSTEPSPADSRHEAELLRAEMALVLERAEDAETMLEHVLAQDDLDEAGAARAWLLRGAAAASRGDAAAALEAHREALRAAERAGHVRAVVTAMLGLALASREAGNVGNAELLLTLARARAAGPHGAAVARADLDHAESVLAHDRGDYATALELVRSAYEQRVEALGPLHPQTAEALGLNGACLRSLGRYDEARSSMQRAIDVASEAYGEDHPAVGVIANNLGAVANSEGELATAEAHYRRAHEIFAGAYGADHPRVAHALHNLAGIAGERGEIETALELLRRALAIAEERLPPAHPMLAKTLLGLGTSTSLAGRHDEGLELLHRARRVQEEAHRDHPDLAWTYNAIALVHARKGEHAAALQWAQESTALRGRSLGTHHPLYARALVTQGAEENAVGDRDAAVSSLERSLEILQDVQGFRGVRAEAQFELGRASDDPDRARRLVDSARDLLGPGENPTLAAAIESWLEEHGGRSD